MKSLILWLVCVVCACGVAVAQGEGGGLVYPKAKTVDQVDDYHGVKVADPYRWLEDTDSPDTHAWVEAENKLTFSYLEQIPYRGAIRERLTKLSDGQCDLCDGGRRLHQDPCIKIPEPKPCFRRQIRSCVIARR